VDENFDGAFYLLQEAENIYNTVTPQALPPIIDDMTSDPDGNYIVSWEEQNPEAAPDVFQLDELSELSISTDDAESGSTHWTLDGFSISNSRSHSGSYSYKSRHTNEDVSSMTTNQPISITENANLSFWCWYNIEDDYDYAMVEISRDGRSYDLLDTFNGYSNDWLYQEYDLSEYTGESIFLRFRYTTDWNTLEEGFYVDDISPVAEFDTITTLSDSITTTYYEITGKPNGTYYYRVKGHNDERAWGDFSTLEDIIVGSGGDTEPPLLEIRKPEEKYLYILNSKLIPFITTLIIGPITVEVNATDVSGVQRVEFYLDNTLIDTVTSEPYAWTWNTLSLSRYTIKTIAYDQYNNHANQTITVWKIL
jgi:hypothetical protein